MTTRASGNGTAGIPVFERKNWRHLDSKRSPSDFYKPSSIQSNEERLEVSQFSMMILEHEASEQIGDG